MKTKPRGERATKPRSGKKRAIRAKSGEGSERTASSQPRGKTTRDPAPGGERAAFSPPRGKTARDPATSGERGAFGKKYGKSKTTRDPATSGERGAFGQPRGKSKTARDPATSGERGAFGLQQGKRPEERAPSGERRFSNARGASAPHDRERHRDPRGFRRDNPKHGARDPRMSEEELSEHERPVSSIGERRALSHVGGKVELKGEHKELFAVIERALAVDSDESIVRAHVHGFHSYPARLHPLTAQRLIEGLSTRGSLVLDAFCGSGTVLVEACLLGRRAAGVDINPIAIELARFKVTESSAAERQAWLEAAERAADHAEERRVDKAGPTRLYRPHEREPYDPHMLFELDGLSAGIAREDKSVQRVLRLILSSILTKVSKSPGDTSDRRLKRRLATGFAIRTFRNKASEVVSQHASYSAALPKLETRGPRAMVVQGDARKLPRIEPMSVDLVVSSPPYPGVFDYLQHHETRLQWLGLDGGELARNEIGSRRQLSKLDPEEALYRWQGDLRACLRAMAQVLKPSGKAALVIADSALKLMPVYADDLLIELAPSAGLEVLAIGSQMRPHFHAPTLNAFKGRARREHLILLGPSKPQARRGSPHKPPRARFGDTGPRNTQGRRDPFDREPSAPRKYDRADTNESRPTFGKAPSTPRQREDSGRSTSFDRAASAPLKHSRADSTDSRPTFGKAPSAPREQSRQDRASTARRRYKPRPKD